MRYEAVVRHEDGVFLVEFPDCPGCQTFAESGDEVVGMAREALEGWLEAHLVDGKAPPRPTRHETAPAGGTLLGILVGPGLSAALSLRWARQDAGLTQGELAKLAGVSQQQIAKLENPDENPTIGTLQKAASALGLHVSIDIASLRELSETPVRRAAVRVRRVRKAVA
jgi:predicted RNase H-like HicB family nuclease/DNA-binding XRE family transcriptional regulator